MKRKAPLYFSEAHPIYFIGTLSQTLTLRAAFTSSTYLLSQIPGPGRSSDDDLLIPHHTPVSRGRSGPTGFPSPQWLSLPASSGPASEDALLTLRTVLLRLYSPEKSSPVDATRKSLTITALSIFRVSIFLTLKMVKQLSLSNLQIAPIVQRAATRLPQRGLTALGLVFHWDSVPNPDAPRSTINPPDPLFKGAITAFGLSFATRLPCPPTPAGHLMMPC